MRGIEAETGLPEAGEALATGSGGPLTARKDDPAPESAFGLDGFDDVPFVFVDGAEIDVARAEAPALSAPEYGDAPAGAAPTTEGPGDPAAGQAVGDAGGASGSVGGAAALGFFGERAAEAVSPNGTAATIDPASFTGLGQVIVVIDDGTSPFYDQSNTLFSYDFAGRRNDADASVSKIDSHGSWVAQMALSEAPDAGIIHLKVFPDFGGTAALRDIEEALDFVIAVSDEVSIAAVNLSLGFGNTARPVLTSLSDEFATLESLGITAVAAAGNAGQSFADGVSVIAADPNVVAVSATDDSDRLAGFSQASDTLTDVAADGVNQIVETVGGTRYAISGTSFAAPLVSGTAARLSQASEELLGEDLTTDELLDILERSGDPVRGSAVPYSVADGDVAVAYFVENFEDYADPLLV